MKRALSTLTPAEIIGRRLSLETLPPGAVPAPQSEMERVRDLLRDHERRLRRLEEKP
jgi:hypothetical protein